MDAMPVLDEVYEAIDYEVARHKLECADNYRAYRVRDRFGFAAFLDKDRRGCCGSFESSYIDTNGDKWIIGCNYGH